MSRIAVTAGRRLMPYALIRAFSSKTGTPAAEQVSTAANLVNSRFKIHKVITRVEPLRDAEEDVTGYIAYTQP